MLICHAPNIQFSVSVLENTLDILSWIMTVKTSLVNRILAHMTQTWESIAIQKLGIYSENSSLNPFEGPMVYGTPPPMPSGVSCEPHSVWIKFLLDRLKFDRLEGSDCLYLYSSFIRMACQKNFSLWYLWF